MRHNSLGIKACLNISISDARELFFLKPELLSDGVAERRFPQLKFFRPSDLAPTRPTFDTSTPGIPRSPQAPKTHGPMSLPNIAPTAHATATAAAPASWVRTNEAKPLFLCPATIAVIPTGALLLFTGRSGGIEARLRLGRKRNDLAAIPPLRTGRASVGMRSAKCWPWWLRKCGFCKQRLPH